jgi:hypothetical protein
LVGARPARSRAGTSSGWFVLLSHIAGEVVEMRAKIRTQRRNRHREGR